MWALAPPFPDARKPPDPADPMERAEAIPASAASVARPHAPRARASRVRATAACGQGDTRRTGNLYVAAGGIGGVAPRGSVLLGSYARQPRTGTSHKEDAVFGRAAWGANATRKCRNGCPIDTFACGRHGAAKGTYPEAPGLTMGCCCARGWKTTEAGRLAECSRQPALPHPRLARPQRGRPHETRTTTRRSSRGCGPRLRIVKSWLGPGGSLFAETHRDIEWREEAPPYRKRERASSTRKQAQWTLNATSLPQPRPR